MSTTTLLATYFYQFAVVMAFVFTAGKLLQHSRQK